MVLNKAKIRQAVTDGKVKMNIPAILKKALRIKCNHKSAESGDFKFCPDCGQKIETRLVIIKCAECGRLRAAQKSSHNSVIPKKKFCGNCGSEDCLHQNYYDYNIPAQLRDLAVKQVAEVKENPFITCDSFTRVYVENPFEAGKNKNKHYRGRNVIKAQSRKTL